LTFIFVEGSTNRTVSASGALAGLPTLSGIVNTTVYCSANLVGSAITMPSCNDSTGAAIPSAVLFSTLPSVSSVPAGTGFWISDSTSTTLLAQVTSGTGTPAANTTVKLVATTVSSTPEWLVVDGAQTGAGGGGAELVSVNGGTFTATPTYTCGSSKSVTTFLVPTMTGNITSSTLSGCSTGQTLVFVFPQDGTGGHTAVMPSGFDAANLSPTASTTTTLTYAWDATNTAGHYVNSSTDTASAVFLKERSAAGTPASGAAVCYPDSTSHTGWTCKANNSATTYSVVNTGGQVNTTTGNVTSVSASALPVAQTVVDTSTPVTVSTTISSEQHINENATAATAVTYNLPTAAAGKQFCFYNGHNGSAANTGVLTVATSATGQFIIFSDGTLSATGGNVQSAGAGGDAGCVTGVDSTHWRFIANSTGWTKH
jgi:hypothetical protein